MQQFPIHVQMSSASDQQGDWVIPLFLIWTVVWLIVLTTLLYRKDFDPVTKLMWVVVVIFVPFFGVLLYWFCSGEPRKIIDPSNQLSGTPWEKNPAYIAKNKEV